MSYAIRDNDVILRNVRLSYVRFDKAVARQPNQEAKYSCTVLLPKSDVAQKQAMDNAIAAAIVQGREKFGKAVPPKPKTVIWDGDGYTQTGKEFGPEAKGCWVFTANLSESRGPVQVVDLNRQPILNASEIYSGMYANVLISFYMYNNESIGVGAGLGPVQKVADGEPLGGKLPSADDVFGAPLGDPTPVAMYTAAPGMSINPLTGQPM